MKLGLSVNIKGTLYFVGGLIAFVYTNGWFEKELYYVMLAGSIAAMTYGFIVTDMWDKLNDIISKFKNSNSNQDGSKE